MRPRIVVIGGRLLGLTAARELAGAAPAAEVAVLEGSWVGRVLHTRICGGVLTESVADSFMVERPNAYQSRATGSQQPKSWLGVK
jgi:protoporphyrinogen oxidase